MSIPFSSIALSVSDAMVLAGASPALAGAITSLPYTRANASAIWLRHEFPMQTKRTRFNGGFTASPGNNGGLVNRQSAPDGRLPPGVCPVPQAPDLHCIARAH